MRVLITLPEGGISAWDILVVTESMLLAASFYLMLIGRKVGFYLLCALATADTVLAGMTLKDVEIFQVIANIVKIAILRLILQGSWKDMR